MSEMTPTDEHLALLEAIQETGGLDCSGNCRIRRPGEVHCQTLGAQIGISSTTAKVMVQQLVEMDLVLRAREDVEGRRFITKFTVSPVGERVLETYQRRLKKKGLSG